MSCCGKRREQVGTTNITYRARNQTISATPEPQITKQFVICFEYVGKTGLTVLGPVSGKRYRFDRTGTRVIVDPRDRPSLLLVPNLKQIRNFAEVNR